MKHTTTTLLATSIGLLFASSASAAVPHTFSSGSPALASEVNANFSDLDTRLSTAEGKVATLETDVDSVEGQVGTLGGDITALTTRVATLESASPSSGAYTTVAIDCSSDASALATALEDSRNATTRTTYNVTGDCDAVVIDRNDVKIVGTGSNSIAGDADYNESMFISSQSNVRLESINVLGNIVVKNSSVLRMDDVGFSSPQNDDTNLDVRNAYVRINSGSVDNITVRVNRNSTMDIKSSVTGTANEVVVDANSTLVSESANISMGMVEAVASSFIYANHIAADQLLVEVGSVIEADSINITNEVGISKNSTLLVEGNAIAGYMGCDFASSFRVRGDLTLNSVFDWGSDDEPSLNINYGCNGQIEGARTIFGDIDIFGYSTLIDGQWAEIAATPAP